MTHFGHNLQILLIGIGGAYNYGCEAIVRGTEAIIHSEWPDARIIYASRRPDDDRVRLSGCNIEIVYRKTRRFSAKNIIRKLLWVTGIRWMPMSDSLSLLKEYNAVLSIGGDIYTLDNNGAFNGSLAKFGDAVEKHGIPYILWGASVGPFDKHQKAEMFFQKHLVNVSLITARERGTLEYLASIGISSNVVSCADPGFLVAPNIVKQDLIFNIKKRIAINLSPLSIMQKGIDLNETIKSQAEFIEIIINKYNIEVILIPHVVCSFREVDDDLRYLRRIYEKINPSSQNKVKLIDNDPGYIGIKQILIQCDLVIAARMHCAINAMASHVPTLLLGYSQKAFGMCEYIYGHSEWVLPLNKFNSEECLNVICKMIENKTAIQVFLKKRIPKVQLDAMRPLTELKNIL